MIKFLVMRQKAEFDMEKFFVALSDRTRLRLINLMSGGEICVCFLVAVLEAPQPKVSRHLAYLREAGLVEARRDGKWMHYRLVEPSHEHAEKILRGVLEWLRDEPGMRDDRARLSNVCCAPQPPVQLIGAPRPSAFRS